MNSLTVWTSIILPSAFFSSEGQRAANFTLCLFFLRSLHVKFIYFSIGVLKYSGQLQLELEKLTQLRSKIQFEYKKAL